MRSVPDRVRHALMFEVIGLAIFIPGSAVVFGKPMEAMGFVGVASATIATLWNFAFNWLFDRAMLPLTGTVEKTLPIRVFHTFAFQAGLMLMLVPMIAWHLGISLIDAFIMDLSIATFYLVHAFVFNLAYDRVFPIPGLTPARQS
jgi:uncharacterized membrane protein